MVQMSDFPRLVDAVGGIDVVVIDDLTDPCLSDTRQRPYEWRAGILLCCPPAW